MAQTLLYICYVDLDQPGGSGSAVRPQQMLKAFQGMDIELKVLYGEKNNFKERRKNLRKINRWLDDHKADYCYIEPSSGPIFSWGDIRLMKRLKKMQVPMTLFYRDCHWMFPYIYGKTVGRLKLKIIYMMSKRDFNLFGRVCNKLYYPSKTMAELMPQYTDWEPLPPGCEILDIDKTYKEDIDRLQREDMLTLFFVGGATERYGTDILLDALDYVRREGEVARLILICPKEQWEVFSYRKKYENASWLYVYHLSSGSEMEKLYAMSDIGVIPQRNTIYEDFAVNVKLFEYIAHAKPILATNCIEVSRVVKNYDCGWIVKADAESLGREIMRINRERSQIFDKKKNCLKAIQENSWQARAQKVIQDLEQLRHENTCIE